MKITVIGTGFVGVVSAAVYAKFSHQVVGLDIDQQKIELLKKSQVPFFEPQLETLLQESQSSGHLDFTTDYTKAIPDSEVIIVAVGTPSLPSGEADLTYLFKACESLAPYLSEKSIVVVKSTVPPGTLNNVQTVIASHTDVLFYTASLPEFLKEGSAVYDTLHPDRIVIGANDKFVFDKLEKLHEGLKAPVIRVSPESAQMGKYSANAYLATRITFINQIADLCEKNGADVNEVIQIIGQDKRIGQHYWYPGFGYGGSCFPKDVKELVVYSRKVGLSNNLFNKINDLNQDRISQLMNEYSQIIGGFDHKTVAVLGLSFKPNTNDMREAPSIGVIDYLSKTSASIKAYDPKSIPSAPYFITNNQVNYVESVKEAINNSDVIFALIEWPEIINFDFVTNKDRNKQYFIDARNQFDQTKLTQAGYIYIGVGRGHSND